MHAIFTPKRFRDDIDGPPDGKPRVVWKPGVDGGGANGRITIEERSDEFPFSLSSPKPSLADINP